MRLDLYQAETEHIAAEQQTILDDARAIIGSGRHLTPLEQSGVLHALQIIIENAIGKAKHWLKANNLVVPVSAYDAFAALASANAIRQESLPEWNAVIGLHNRIVHDYMNIEFDQVLAMIRERRESFIIDFLLRETEILKIPLIVIQHLPHPPPSLPLEGGGTESLPLQGEG